MISCISLTSCFSTNKLISKSESKSIEFSIKKLNGSYSNQIENNEKVGLWNILADNKSFKGDWNKVVENSYVKFEMNSETELKVSLIENDSIIKKMELKGKIVNDYFSIKKKFLLIPVPAFLFLRERKTIIANDAKGNLILTRGYKNGAWFLVMASDFGGISSHEFKRIIN